MKERSEDGIVLRTYKSGEADRIAVLWTREHGKVRVLARGARGAASRLGGALEVLGVVRVDLVGGRGDLSIVRHVRHLAHHPTLRGDYDRIAAGYAVVEALDAIPAEDVADESIYDLAVRVLGALDDPAYRPALVPASFYFRLLALDGSGPVVDRCVSCGRSDGLVAFDAASGGVTCVDCRRGVSVSPAALALVRRVTGGDLGAVLREDDPAGAGEVAALAQAAVEDHFGRRLRSARATAPLAGS